MELQQGIVVRGANCVQKWGNRFEVMLEGPSERDRSSASGKHGSQGMAPEIDGKVYITEFEGVTDAADLPSLPGTLATARSHLK